MAPMSNEHPEPDFEGPDVGKEPEPDAEGIRPTGDSEDVEADIVSEEVRDKLD